MLLGRWRGLGFPVRAAVVYGALGVAWILFSDWFVATIGDTPERMRTLQSLKGVAFVVVSVILVYAIARLEQIRTGEARLAGAERDHAVRALRSLIGANHAIVTSTSHDAVFDNVCRTLADEGGYPLVWIGLADDDAARTIRPVAAAGPEAGRAEAMRLSWNADDPAGQGPAGEAVRGGRVTFASDLSGHAEFAPWRGRADGLGALVAVPLRIRGRVSGILLVSGTEVRALEDDDVRMLANIGEDIGHAYDALQSEAERIAALEENRAMLNRTVDTLARAIEARDPYTAGHQARSTELAVAIGRRLGLDEPQLEALRLAASIHDIGNIAVPSEILNRPGRLSAEELDIVRQHPEFGAEIVKDAQLPDVVADVMLHHHERFDGSGYPEGLAGEQISLAARIVSVADVVGAMASHRPYRPALGLDKAIEEIEAGRGTRYDPDVVDACLGLFRERGEGLLQSA